MMQKNPDNRRNLFPNYQFLVYVKEVELHFSKINGIEAGVEIEEFQIGGRNDSPYYTVGPKKKAGTLTLEKGITLSEDVKKWKPGFCLKGPIEIFIMSDMQARTYVRSYYMIGGVISKWEINPLDSLGNDILIDKFEMVHSGIVAD